MPFPSDIMSKTYACCEMHRILMLVELLDECLMRDEDRPSICQLRALSSATRDTIRAALKDLEDWKETPN